MNKIMDTKIVEEATFGNPSALEFLKAMGVVLHFYDDLIDRDKEMVDEHTHRVMWLALVVLPRNEFYRENMASLSPILVNAICNWRTANAVEREVEPHEPDLRWAFIIRSSYVDLVSMCAVIIGGMDHAVAIGPELRRWAHSEGFMQYIDNLNTEQRTREHGHVL